MKILFYYENSQEGELQLADKVRESFVRKFMYRRIAWDKLQSSDLKEVEFLANVHFGYFIEKCQKDCLQGQETVLAPAHHLPEAPFHNSGQGNLLDSTWNSPVCEFDLIDVSPAQNNDNSDHEIPIEAQQSCSTNDVLRQALLSDEINQATSDAFDTLFS